MTLAAWQNVRVTDQLDIAHLLNPHHADERAVGLVPPERHSSREFAIQLVRRHIRVGQEALRDDPTVGLGCGVNDPEDARTLEFATGPNGAHTGAMYGTCRRYSLGA